jgi:hypothetical protein
MEERIACHDLPIGKPGSSMPTPAWANRLPPASHSPGRGTSRLAGYGCAALAGCAAFVVWTALAASALAAEPHLRVEPGPSGEVAVTAQGVPIVRALEAVAAVAGFDVTVSNASSRPSANVTTDMAAVEDVLRAMLRHRNYALVFDSDGSVNEVFLLPPSTAGPSRPTRPLRRPPRSRSSRAQSGPIVVIN